MEDNSLYIASKSYLMELISRELKFLRGKIKSAMGGQDLYAIVMNEVNDIFYGQSFSQNKRLIKEFKEHFPTKSYADYNFFDLDTLSSYLDYLRDLNFTIDDLSRKNRGSLTRNILNSALIANASKYNDSIRKNYIKIPTLEVNEDHKLTPSRLKGKWEQKDVWMYQNYIRERKAPKSTKVQEAVREDEQLTFRFNAPWGAKKEEPVTPVKKEDPVMPVKQNSYESDSSVERYINYKYNGKMYRLKVNKEDVYRENGGVVINLNQTTMDELCIKIKINRNESLLISYNGNVSGNKVITLK